MVRCLRDKACGRRIKCNFSDTLHANTSTNSRTRRPLRVLAVTRIFPNQVEPLACPFQRHQLKALSKEAEVEVLGVIPYLPGASMLGDKARVGRLARVPARDVIDGLKVVHPRAPYVPGAGPHLSALNAPLYLAGLLPHLSSLRGRFDVVLGAWLYPDAWAAGMLGHALGLPYAVKAHGTDVNVVARWPSVRGLVRRTLRKAGAVVGVSRPMLDALVELGAPEERVTLVRNGVDRSLFRPGDKREARRALGLPEEGKIILYVGRLEETKGLGELAAAFATLEKRGQTDARLVVVGDGSMRRALERVSSREGAVVLAGNRPAADVARYLTAADVLTLPSWNEGTPNVILEALAAGRPVVATRVGGIPDVVEEGRTGLLVPVKDVPTLADALGHALSREWPAEEITRAAPPSWETSAGHLLAALERAVAARAS